MSPIIEAMKPSPNSDRQSCASLGELFPKNGTAFATESPTTFVSSRPTIFGSSRRPGKVVDPVSAGFVTNLARPEGNITGFTNFEFSVGGKWLQLLKECAPTVDRIAVVFYPANPTWGAYLRTIEAAAPSFGVRLIPAGVRDAAEITQRIATFARDPNGALVVLPSPVTIRHRETIIVAAARHRLPPLYPYRFFTVDGGLMSYSSDVLDQYRRAASYVDRILRGAKVAELPVQQPIKYELTINLKTVKTLGLTIPDSLLARA